MKKMFCVFAVVLIAVLGVSAQTISQNERSFPAVLNSKTVFTAATCTAGGAGTCPIITTNANYTTAMFAASAANLLNLGCSIDGTNFSLVKFSLTTGTLTLVTVTTSSANQIWRADVTGCIKLQFVNTTAVAGTVTLIAVDSTTNTNLI